MQRLQLISWEAVQAETLHSSSLQMTYLAVVHSKLQPLALSKLYFLHREQRLQLVRITMRWRSLIFHQEDRRRSKV